MSPKYSTGDNDTDATVWRSDTHHVLTMWSAKPFQGHRHRHETVEQRLAVEYSHGVGIDILWEARSTDSGHFADDWQPVATLEVREWGATLNRRPESRWLE